MSSLCGVQPNPKSIRSPVVDMPRKVNLAVTTRTREFRSLSMMEAAPTPNPNPAGTGGSRPARRLPVAPDSEAAAARDPNKSPRPIYYRRYAGRRFPGKMPLSHT